ncbi:hypothetical protein [Streptomyces sp. NPDC046712]|uniref:hypothetical protein n=1 Tax=Streptomyces sp. NPDC046712 TaxID=3154802 RepID=UPI0033FA02C6
MQITTGRANRRLLSVAGMLAVSAATLLSSGGAANAAPTAETASVGIQDATLGQTCVGPSYNRKFAFTITSTTGVPAGSTWKVTVSKPGYQGLQVGSDSGYVPGATGTTQVVNLSAPSGIPAGTTVTLTPTYYLIPTSGYNSLTLSGYGGSTSVAMNWYNRPC